jgi:hypothetical protein
MGTHLESNKKRLITYLLFIIYYFYLYKKKWKIKKENKKSPIEPMVGRGNGK